jgi:SAM-dependent methyltransferase
MTLAAPDRLQISRSRSCACQVCAAPAERFLSVGGSDYFRCPRCDARFLDPSRHPKPEAERAQYLLHRNDPDDPRYRRFLAQVADPLLARLAPRSRGLDYGCGPGPALAAMLREAGHEVALYDPVFVPDPAPLARDHDFVTCTEVAEHFHHPAREFERLRRLVRPGGWLAVMTRFAPGDADFARWAYRRDPTHVAFYGGATFRHLAEAWGWSCEVPGPDVALLQRPDAGAGT